MPILRTRVQATLAASFRIHEALERLHYSAGNISPTLPVYRDVRRLLPTNVVTGLYEKNRLVINREKFLRVEGVLQSQDNVISIKATRVMPVAISAAETQSHDFH
jgi:hypothetical protein